MPKVTIIVTSQNTDTHTPRCLESLLGQTEDDLEIIITTTESVDSPKDPRLVWLPSSATHSLAYTINLSLKIAKASHILFVNPNAVLNTELIETVIPWAQLTDNDLVLFGHVTHRDSVEEVYLPLLRVGDDKESIFRAFLLEHKGIGIHRWQYLYKKDFLIKKNIWHDESLSHFDDLLFVAKALLHCNGVSSISKPLYHHFKNPYNGLPFPHRTQDRFAAIESIKQMLLKANAFEKYKDEFTLFMLRFGYILTTYEYLNLSNGHVTQKTKQYIREVLNHDTFKKIDINSLQLPSDNNRNKNTLSYKELQRLKTTICDRFTLLEISYKITLKLLRYKNRPLWNKIPKLLRNSLLILQESKRAI